MHFYLFFYLLSHLYESKKVFDLSKEYPEFIVGDLHNNIDKFIQIYGFNFKLKYGSILINIIIKKITLPSDIEFYRMLYDIPHRISIYTPFIIDFIDYFNLEKNNNSYISNIQKTNNISGSDMVKICLKINKILGAKKTLLEDYTTVTTVNEEFDLPFLKLIERGTTFYMDLGFKFEFGSVLNVFFYYRFTDEQKFLKELNKILNKIKKLKIKKLIKKYNDTLDLLNIIIKDNYIHKLEILNDNSDPTRHDEIYVEHPKEKIIDIFIECVKVLDILNKYSHEKYLYKIFIKLFKEAKDEYSIILRYIAKNNRSKLIYNNKIISRDYLGYFKFLLNYRYRYQFSYTFY